MTLRTPDRFAQPSGVDVRPKFEAVFDLFVDADVAVRTLHADASLTLGNKKPALEPAFVFAGSMLA
jgi:hypothetical protein